MRVLLHIFSAIALATGLHAEQLQITLGAEKDFNATLGSTSLLNQASQSKDPANPVITISHLDLDQNGTADDRIEIQYSVSAEGGPVKRMASGYRLDPGHSLTFNIESATVIRADGKSAALDGRFISVEGNNKASTFTTDNQGNTITLKSTSKSNQRIRNIIATFDIAAISTPSPVAPKAAPRSRAVTKPKPSVAPVVLKTDSVKLPRLFCNNMILQQQTKNTFWGWANPGEQITVNASWGAEASAKADSNGRWKLFLETPEFGTGHALTIQGAKDRIEIKNVAIGEVWLCAGQSNMGWAMGNCFETEQDPNVNLPDLRIFKSQREHWHEPLELQRDRLSHWKTCTPESAAETSAVSYWFAKKLHTELGMPVGIIQQAYAGTPIEGWMPWDIQKDDERARVHKAAYDASAERQAGSGDTEEKALATFETELAEYNAKIDAGETMKNSVKPLAPPIITKPANLGHQYPGHQFNAMIHPIRPYGIRGAIWYQGERNSKDVPQAFHYRNQLAQLIEFYRSSWHEGSGGNVSKEFPFQFTQLPSWTPEQTDPVEGLSAPWAANRESMLEVTKNVPNTGMAVSIDTGDATALHPKNKKPIGLRHAAVALQQTYGKDFVTHPVYKKNTIKGNNVILEFDSVGSGLMTAKPGKLDTFAIAGADQVWHWADAEIAGHTIIVSSSKVRKPVAVRYAWAMNPSQRNLLYNKEGLPASPFRTDDWPLFDPDEKIVTVIKPAKPEEKSSRDWDRPVMTQ